MLAGLLGSGFVETAYVSMHCILCGPHLEYRRPEI